MVTDEERAATACVIARCKCCDRIDLAICGELSVADKQRIGDAAAAGYSVTTITVGEARRSEWFCNVRRKKQADTPPCDGPLRREPPTPAETPWANRVTGTVR